MWLNFLRSLETEGGKLVVLLSLLMFLLGASLIMVETNHTPQEAGRQMLVGAFSSLLGILYGYLKGGGGSPKA